MPMPGPAPGCTAGREPGVPGSPHPQHRLEAEFNHRQLIRGQRRQVPLTETGAVQGSGLVGHSLAGVEQPITGRKRHPPAREA